MKRYYCNWGCPYWSKISVLKLLWFNQNPVLRKYMFLLCVCFLTNFFMTITLYYIKLMFDEHIWQLTASENQMWPFHARWGAHFRPGDHAIAMLGLVIFFIFVSSYTPYFYALPLKQMLREIVKERSTMSIKYDCAPKRRLNWMQCEFHFHRYCSTT